jgi:hypothetical protein
MPPIGMVSFKNFKMIEGRRKGLGTRDERRRRGIRDRARDEMKTRDERLGSGMRVRIRDEGREMR